MLLTRRNALLMGAATALVPMSARANIRTDIQLVMMNAVRP